MTIHELLDQIKKEGKVWSLTRDGHIRAKRGGPYDGYACPISSLLHYPNGRPYTANQVRTAARKLALNIEDTEDLITAADTSLFFLRRFHARLDIIKLRKQLLAACRLHEPEEEQP